MPETQAPIQDSQDADTDPCINENRVRLALQATYRVEAMVNALRKCARDDDDQLPLLVDSMCSSIHELNSIVMSSLNDELETESQLHFRLYGEALEASHARDGLTSTV